MKFRSGLLYANQSMLEQTTGAIHLPFFQLEQVFKGVLPVEASSLQRVRRGTQHSEEKLNEQSRRYKRRKTPICWITRLREPWMWA